MSVYEVKGMVHYPKEEKRPKYSSDDICSPQDIFYGAIRMGDLERVQELLGRGVDASGALRIALYIDGPVYSKNPIKEKMIKLLSPYYKGPLVHLMEREDLFKEFVPKSSQELKDDALRAACEKHNIELVRTLLKNGANPNGIYPLHSRDATSIRYDHIHSELEVTRLIIQYSNHKLCLDCFDGMCRDNADPYIITFMTWRQPNKMWEQYRNWSLHHRPLVLYALNEITETLRKGFGRGAGGIPKKIVSEFLVLI